MKRIAVRLAALTLVSSASLFAAVPSARLSNAAGPNPLARVSQSENPTKNQATLKTFVGTIAKSGDEFILKDDASKLSYQLDDQQSASKFEGKQVKVTGTLDASNNTIHVQNIEPASA